MNSVDRQDCGKLRAPLAPGPERRFPWSVGSPQNSPWPDLDLGFSSCKEVGSPWALGERDPVAERVEARRQREGGE